MGIVWKTSCFIEFYEYSSQLIPSIYRFKANSDRSLPLKALAFRGEELEILVLHYTHFLLIIKGSFQLLIGVQDEDSCGRSVLGETPQERMRRGSPTARGKRRPARKSTAV
jgi:hypothetical protein